MADTQPDAHGMSQGVELRRLIRRRRVLIGIGCLLGIAVICVAAITIMLQRLEARNASFQPPMTALERQRMLPSDPVLSATPQLEGLHYRSDDPLKVEGLSPTEDADLQFNQMPLDRAPTLQGSNLRANSDFHGVSQKR